MLGNTSLFGVLQYPAYRRLFAAQVVSLLGTGLALLPWDYSSLNWEELMLE